MKPFEEMTAVEKGYAVYTYGENPDYPDIPKTYAPTTPQARMEYNKGQWVAMLDAQDSEE